VSGGRLRLILRPCRIVELSKSSFLKISRQVCNIRSLPSNVSTGHPLVGKSLHERLASMPIGSCNWSRSVK
jgi:hypothetical protein